MGFLPDGDEIEAFVPYGSDDALCISVLRWASRRYGLVKNSGSFNVTFERAAELCVVVTNQESKSRVLGKRFVDLLGQAHCGWVRCIRYEEQPPAVQPDNDECTQFLIVGSVDSEQSVGGDAVNLAREKCASGRAVALRADARHILCHAKFRDFEVELKKVAVGV